MRRQAAEEERAEPERKSGNRSLAVGGAPSFPDEPGDEHHERQEKERAAHEAILVQALERPVMDVLRVDAEAFGAVLGKPGGDPPRPDAGEGVGLEHRDSGLPESDASGGQREPHGGGVAERGDPAAKDRAGPAGKERHERHAEKDRGGGAGEERAESRGVAAAQPRRGRCEEEDSGDRRADPRRSGSRQEETDEEEGREGEGGEPPRAARGERRAERRKEKEGEVGAGGVVVRKRRHDALHLGPRLVERRRPELESRRRLEDGVGGHEDAAAERHPEDGRRAVPRRRAPEGEEGEERGRVDEGGAERRRRVVGIEREEVPREVPEGAGEERSGERGERRGDPAGGSRQRGEDERRDERVPGLPAVRAGREPAGGGREERHLGRGDPRAVEAGAEDREKRDRREERRGRGGGTPGGEEKDRRCGERDGPRRPLKGEVRRGDGEGEEEGRADEPQDEPEGFPRRLGVGGQTRTSSWSGAYESAPGGAGPDRLDRGRGRRERRQAGDVALERRPADRHLVEERLPAERRVDDEVHLAVDHPVDDVRPPLVHLQDRRRPSSPPARSAAAVPDVATRREAERRRARGRSGGSPPCRRRGPRGTPSPSPAAGCRRRAPP